MEISAASLSSRMTLILGSVIFLVLILIWIVVSHQEIERKKKLIPRKLDKLSADLKTFSVGLSGGTNPKGRETEQMAEEAKKISQLWKSRREQLQMGYWEKMEGRAEELKKLQEIRDHIQELINRTKIKYHKRELDEESFREIVKDYQKQLMEVNVKIWELEKDLG